MAEDNALYEEPYLKGLNPQQQEAVLHTGNPLLILAGAGSGKTRVLTAKIAYLVDKEGVRPDSILAVTFTNKAAAEMRERAAAMVPEAGQAMIRTFHSFGAWLVRRNSHVLPVTSSFTIYDEDDMVQLLSTLYPDRKKRDLRKYTHWISRAKDYCLGPEDAALDGITGTYDFRQVYAAYQKRLRETGNVDFGDLILLPRQLLLENPEIAERIRQRYGVILVDEYQDSNIAQFELLKALKGEHTYLCVVGDDDQSIYRFRGAEVRNIIEFPDYFPGTDVVRLEENYRSTQSILSVASEVVSGNAGRLGKTLWCKRNEGEKPKLAILESQDSEAQYCADLLHDGNLGGTAILYRTNAQSRTFESVFARQGIPYKIVGTSRFYDREEVKDVIAMLSFLMNPCDEVSFQRIVNKPSRGIGKSSLEKVITAAPRYSLDYRKALSGEKEKLSGKAKKGAENFLALCIELDEQLETKDLHVFVNYLIHHTGLKNYHEKQDEVAGTQKVINLEEVINAAGEYPNGREGLTEFLEHIELDRIREEGMEQEESVTLITLHNTKGLEFDRVIITGLEEGVFPRNVPEIDEEELEEERRLFYVGITRARNQLYMTACRQRRIMGRIQNALPSRFLQEIPEQLIQVEGSHSNGVIGAGSGPSIDGFAEGSRVIHGEYGEGTIIRKSYEDGELMLVVRFDSGRTGVVLPEYMDITPM